VKGGPEDRDGVLVQGSVAPSVPADR